MAWTPADLTSIEEAIASGTTSVRHGDKTVQYQTLDELRALRLEILRALYPNRQPRVGVAGYRKGV